MIAINTRTIRNEKKNKPLDIRLPKPIFLCLLLMSLLFCRSISAGGNTLDLTEMSIEELMEIEVTSVSKKAQNLSESPAAIFVITGDDLRRSGVTNIPDALRMVPGITVARIDASKWAVSSRGSNSRFYNKLLVLIDGRSVYTPFFSGVYWEAKNVMLEDVQRIEVIRGPGAALWGANAVDGVINIITRSAKDTQGGLVTAGVGSVERTFGGVRYGWGLGEDTHARLYAQGNWRDEFTYLDDTDAGDDWNTHQGGFRMDSELTTIDTLTVQGDIYQGKINQEVDVATLSEGPGSVPQLTSVDDEADMAGGNLLTRWQRIFSSSSDLSLQVYFDRADRQEAYVGQRHSSFDVDFQHHLRICKRVDAIWGLRFRRSWDKLDSTYAVTVDPTERTDDLFSSFFQDEITLVDDRLWLTVGTKMEHNDYTGYEVQPDARLFWAVDDSHYLWAAVSRAVRTPSRFETDGRLVYSVYSTGTFPVVPTVWGSDDFISETLIAYEMGYRFVPDRAVSIDMAAFYNDYDHLRTIELGSLSPQTGYVLMPFTFSNDFAARTYGAELALRWQATSNWKLDFAYTYLESDLEEGLQAGKAPEHQVSLRSATALGRTVDLDLWLRYVDDTTTVYAYSPAPNYFYSIDDYFTLDVRLAWRPRPSVELSVIGQNLLAPSHLEFVQETFGEPTTVPRSVYGKIEVRF